MQYLFDGYAGDSSSFKRHWLLLTGGDLQRADMANIPTALWCDLALGESIKEVLSPD